MGNSLGHVESLNDEIWEPQLISDGHKKEIRNMMCEHFIKNGTSKMNSIISKIEKYLRDKKYTVKNMFEATPEHDNDLFCVHIWIDGTQYFTTIKQTHVDNYILEKEQVIANNG